MDPNTISQIVEAIEVLQHKIGLGLIAMSVFVFACTVLIILYCSKK